MLWSAEQNHKVFVGGNHTRAKCAVLVDKGEDTWVIRIGFELAVPLRVKQLQTLSGDRGEAVKLEGEMDRAGPV